MCPFPIASVKSVLTRFSGDSEDEVIKYCDKMGKLYKAARVLKQSQRAPETDD
jgi:hypothetical protein